MRRPLNWIVVAISLLVLLANRMVDDPLPPGKVPATASIAAAPGLFAYVREDGTQDYLPLPLPLPWPDAPPPEPLTFEKVRSAEDVHAASGFGDPADLETAVYTWTTPVLTVERPALQ